MSWVYTRIHTHTHSSAGSRFQHCTAPVTPLVTHPWPPLPLELPPPLWQIHCLWSSWVKAVNLRKLMPCGNDVQHVSEDLKTSALHTVCDLTATQPINCTPPAAPDQRTACRRTAPRRTKWGSHRGKPPRLPRRPASHCTALNRQTWKALIKSFFCFFAKVGKLYYVEVLTLLY